jgi:hypothetical protein
MTISLNRVVLVWATSLFFIMALRVMAAKLLLDTGTPTMPTMTTMTTTEDLLAMPAASTIVVVSKSKRIWPNPYSTTISGHSSNRCFRSPKLGARNMSPALQLK